MENPTSINQNSLMMLIKPMVIANLHHTKSMTKFQTMKLGELVSIHTLETSLLQLAAQYKPLKNKESNSTMHYLFSLMEMEKLVMLLMRMEIK